MLHETIWVTSNLLSIQRSDMKLQSMCGSNKVTKQKEQDEDSSFKATTVFCILWRCRCHTMLPWEVLSMLWLRTLLDNSSVIPRQPVLEPWQIALFLLECHNQDLSPSNKMRTQPNSQHISVMSVIGEKKLKDCMEMSLNKQDSMKKKNQSYMHVLYST